MTYIEGRRRLLPEPKLIDFLLLGLVGGIAGGRVIYAALFDPAYYFEQPQRLLYFQDCGFSFWGGLAGALLVIFIWGYRENLIVERYLDAAAPVLAFSLLQLYGFSIAGEPHGNSLSLGRHCRGKILPP